MGNTTKFTILSLDLILKEISEKENFSASHRSSLTYTQKLEVSLAV